MRCPFCCDDNTQVKDSRSTEGNTVIRRRRLCGACGARFTTFERIQLRDLVVIKNCGDSEVFTREKLMRSLTIATRKRDISDERIEMAVNDIIRQLENQGEGKIYAKDIGELVMQSLKHLDKISYIRYASVYKNFDEVTDFKQYINEE